MKVFELKDAAWMPYALVKIECAPYPHVWLPVNRDYERPEGVQWDYDAHIDKAILFARDPRSFDCWVGDTTGRYLYLFDTVHDAAADYHARLQRLHAEEWRSYRERLQ
jgi:hypothetical protein